MHGVAPPRGGRSDRHTGNLGAADTRHRKSGACPFWTLEYIAGVATPWSAPCALLHLTLTQGAEKFHSRLQGYIREISQTLPAKPSETPRGP